MTKLDALKGLADRIVAEDAHLMSLHSNVWGWRGFDVLEFALGAYNGSLDAALSLHKAVVPEWIWTVVDSIEGWQAILEVPIGIERVSEVSFESPARAWLLAIIRALIVKEESK